MARRISSRLKIYGTLQAETPLHVGGYGVDIDTDLPLARNGKGELYIPGTSLTGVLRAWCQSSFGDINSLFGYQDGDKGHASFVLIEDAVITLPGDLQIEIRDGVGIDRIYGTAAEGAKYDRAILPKGSKFHFEMTVEIEARKKSTKNGKTEVEGKDETKHEFEKRVKETEAIIIHMLSALKKERFVLERQKLAGLDA